MRKYLIIINQQSGTAKETDLKVYSRQLVEIFKAQDTHATVKLVNADQLNNTLNQAISNNYDAIIVGGGDGTVNTAAGLLENSKTAFGFLPMGTFNLAARDHNIPLDLIQAAETLARSEPHSTPLLRINGKACLCVTMLGFYPKILKKMESYHGKKWWIKTWNIAKLCLVNFTKSPRYKIRFRQGDHEIHKTSYMLSIVPGAYQDELGVIPKVAPVSQGTQQKASIYFFQHKSRLKMLYGMLSYVFGELKADEDLTVITFTNARLNFKKYTQLDAMLDGESLKLDTPIDLDFKENALQILKPIPIQTSQDSA